MGYFANGIEGDLYEAEYCAKCAHGGCCAVWYAHLVHGYRECNNADSILHMLIPRAEGGVYNERCLMFLAKTKTAE